MPFIATVLGGLKAGASWLINNPAVLMTGVIAVMFVMVTLSKNAEINQLEKANAAVEVRNERLITSLGQARANVATLNQSLTKQSDSIALLAKRGTESAANFDKLVAGMASQNATVSKKLALIDGAKPGPDKCVSALALVRSAVQ